MRKKLLSAVVVLLSGSWATAQESRPGYAFLGSGKQPARSVVVPASGVPPEPGSLGAMAGLPPDPSSYPIGVGPVGVAPMGAGPMGVGPMGPAPVSPPVGAPGPYDAAPVYGSGYPGDIGPGIPSDALSSFGTETYWVTGSYLYGWLTRPNLNGPLVTLGSINDPVPGALGQSSTQVLFGQDQYKYQNLHGARVEFGVNLNDRVYLDIQGWGFGPQYTRGVFVSDFSGSPFIARPVINALTNTEQAFLTTSPGLIAGATTVEAKLQMFGFEGNARYQWNATPYLTLDVLAGYKRVQLEEDLTIRDQLVPLTGGSITFVGTPITAPGFVGDYDRFGATNQFNGGQIGGRFRWQSGFDWFALTGFGKVAFGATNQTIEIEGASAASTVAGGATGGVLALSSNIGHHKRQVFGVIPEGGVGLVFLPWRYVRLHAGYSAMYWNDVVRPGDHVDRRVNPNLVPTDTSFGGGNTAAFPAFNFRSRGVWLQTLNFGVELYY